MSSVMGEIIGYDKNNHSSIVLYIIYISSNAPIKLYTPVLPLI
jgi:hypothetical protein